MFDRAPKPRMVSRGASRAREHATTASPASVTAAPFDPGRVSLLPPGGRPAPRRNHFGLPDRLRAGIEALSGVAMDDVRVRYRLPEPARLGALAFARGQDIHLGPGQELHLPHEAWHVAQQARGRVKPTLRTRSGIAVNDDTALEREADLSGQAATHDGALLDRPRSQLIVPQASASSGTVQMIPSWIKGAAPYAAGGVLGAFGLAALGVALPSAALAGLTLGGLGYVASQYHSGATPGQDQGARSRTKKEKKKEKKERQAAEKRSSESLGTSGNVVDDISIHSASEGEGVGTSSLGPGATTEQQGSLRGGRKKERMSKKERRAAKKESAEGQGTSGEVADDISITSSPRDEDVGTTSSAARPKHGNKKDKEKVTSFESMPGEEGAFSDDEREEGGGIADSESDEKEEFANTRSNAVKPFYSGGKEEEEHDSTGWDSRAQQRSAKQKRKKANEQAQYDDLNSWRKRLDSDSSEDEGEKITLYHGSAGWHTYRDKASLDHAAARLGDLNGPLDDSKNEGAFYMSSNKNQVADFVTKKKDSTQHDHSIRKYKIPRDEFRKLHHFYDQTGEGAMGPLMSSNRGLLTGRQRVTREKLTGRKTWDFMSGPLLDVKQTQETKTPAFIDNSQQTAALTPKAVGLVQKHYRGMQKPDDSGKYKYVFRPEGITPGKRRRTIPRHYTNEPYGEEDGQTWLRK